LENSFYGAVAGAIIGLSFQRRLSKSVGFGMGIGASFAYQDANEKFKNFHYRFLHPERDNDKKDEYVRRLNALRKEFFLWIKPITYIVKTH